MGYPYDRDIDAKTELKRWDYRAERNYDMRRLTKTHPFKFSNGSGSSIPDSFIKLMESEKGERASIRNHPEWVSEMPGIFQIVEETEKK